MKDSILALRVGITFVIGLALIWVTYETLTEGTTFGDRGSYEIRGTFDNLKQLRTGDDVRLAGVKIGTVRRIGLEDGRALAVLAIDSQYQIPEDAVATIDMAGLLGSNVVGIKAEPTREGPFLQPGASIRTDSTPDFNTLLSEFGSIGDKVEGFFDKLTGSLTDEDGEGGLLGGAFGDLIAKLEKLVDDNQQAIHNTLANLETVTNNLAEGKGTLGKLINDDEAYDKILSIANQLEGASNDLSELMTEVRGVVGDVREGKGALGMLIYNEEVGTDIARITGNVRDLTDKLLSGEGTLSRLIMEDELYESAQDFMRKAEKTLDGIGDSGPITAVGVAAGALF